MTAIISQNRTNYSFARDYTALVFENTPHILDHFQLRWPLWLFNTPLHVVHQGATQIYTFVLADALTQTEAYGVFHLSVFADTLQDKRIGINPHRASFGSFEVADRVSHADFAEWLTSIEFFAKSHGMSAIEIKHYPHCYNPSRSAFIQRGLLRQGFFISKTTDNQFIEINEKSFEEGLHASERRRLRKCLHAGFYFEEWQNPSPNPIYDFIQHNRQLLGYTLSFSLEQLTMWLSVFPKKYQIFCVKEKNTIASLALTVRVGKQVLYNFCPSDNLSYRTYSPAVLLNKGLYEYAKSEGISILDLGVSIDSDGNAKPTLSRFKHNLGAKDCEKVFFGKEWSLLPV